MCFEPCDPRNYEITGLKDKQFVSDDPELRGIFEKFLADNHIPGGAIGVVKNNRIAALMGAGKANVIVGNPFEYDTVGLVGSVSKTLTALGVLALAGASTSGTGEVEIRIRTEDINPFLPEPRSKFIEVSTQQLLSHTSGIAHHDTPRGGGPFTPANEEDMIDICAGPIFQSQENNMCLSTAHPGIHPRAAYYSYYKNIEFENAAKSGRYSNTNAMLAGAAIDHITQANRFGKARGYENYIWQRVCLPAEMLTPCLMADWRAAEDIIPNRAQGYRLPKQWEIDNNTFPANEPVQMDYGRQLWGWEAPAGGWSMTIGDLCRLMIGINTDRIISAAARTEFMMKPYSEEIVSGLGHTGLGVFLTEDGYSHHGDVDGFTSRYTYFSEANVGVAIILNLYVVKKSHIADLSESVRDMFARAPSASMAGRMSCEPADRFFREHGGEFHDLVRQISESDLPPERAAREVAGFVIRRHGKLGKRLVKSFLDRDYEKAIVSALEIGQAHPKIGIEREPDEI